MGQPHVPESVKGIVRINSLFLPKLNIPRLCFFLEGSIRYNSQLEDSLRVLMDFGLMTFEENGSYSACWAADKTKRILPKLDSRELYFTAYKDCVDFIERAHLRGEAVRKGQFNLPEIVATRDWLTINIRANCYGSDIDLTGASNAISSLRDKGIISADCIGRYSAFFQNSSIKRKRFRLGCYEDIFFFYERDARNFAESFCYLTGKISIVRHIDENRTERVG